MTRRRLSGRRVLVTGAAGAFGSRTCLLLRGRGARVVGLDVRAGEGIVECDLTEPDAVAAAVTETVHRLGGLDLLVHYAGIGEPADSGAPPGPAVSRTLQVNLLGPWRVTAAALPALVEARGRVVFVASELAHATLPFAGAYAVSKRGLTAYADTLRMEYGAWVSVSTVYPGYVRTPIHDASIAAGLSMEGQVRAERVADVASTVLRVAAARRPPRDTAATRLGGVELWLARHLPARVDAVVRSRVTRDIGRGRYDGVALAARMVGLYGRNPTARTAGDGSRGADVGRRDSVSAQDGGASDGSEP